MRETLKHGDRGGAVRELQTMLNTVGANINVDGEFGDITFDTVLDFQAYKGLVEDGVVGPVTWTALDNAIRVHQAMRTRDGIDPCSRAEALQRMEELARIPEAEYRLGTGDYHKDGYAKQYDCAGAAICEAYKLTRHREGFASGQPLYVEISDVDDDINTNSALEDAFGKQELFEIVRGTPEPGDLVMWATTHVEGHDKPFIGHVLMFKSAPAGWQPAFGWHLAKMLQCCGGNGRKPAIIETDGHVIDKHNAQWTKLGQRAWVVRVKQSR